ncbi:MAG: hypothetical protein NC048_04600 [Bacteroides sp.]|nr:hypothetical protein [Ruminococcus flavefaciens]MCM1554755.1 hypothetical protein [Bacteroides sp.]
MEVINIKTGFPFKFLYNGVPFVQNAYRKYDDTLPLYNALVACIDGCTNVYAWEPDNGSKEVHAINDFAIYPVKLEVDEVVFVPVIE